MAPVGSYAATALLSADNMYGMSKLSSICVAWGTLQHGWQGECDGWAVC